MGDELKAWTCARNRRHVLGQVKRNGSRVRQLLLYRQAVDLDGEEMAEVDVMAVVEGHVMDVRCSICGGLRTWVQGNEAEQALVDQVKSRQIAITKFR
jgi:hypothetical protein